MSKIVSIDFFSSDALELSKKLLGKIIARKINGKILRFRIVEVEAYLGLNDEACHSHKKNRQRSKSLPMYNRGGFSYVYLIYGIYHCFNVVAAPKGDPQSVLIRAVEPLDKEFELKTNGPGNLCKALGININLNNVDMIKSEEIWIENSDTADEDVIISSKRVNVGNSEDSHKFLRFYIYSNKFVSKIDKKREKYFLSNII